MTASGQTLSSVLGFPRMGANRELKKACEGFWAGKVTADELLRVARSLRLEHLALQQKQGVDVIPSNDFSFYDHVLDHSILFNVIPSRYHGLGLTPIELLFAMGRGLQRPASGSAAAVDVTSLEMVKWFDSNYHYMRPEVTADTPFKLNCTKPIDEFIEAKDAGIITRPVILGPVTYLTLSKVEPGTAAIDPISLLDKLLPVYETLLQKLAEAGAEWVQIDEPILVQDVSESAKSAYKVAYDFLNKLVKRPKVLLATYFGAVGENLPVLAALPVDGIHVDLVRAPQQLRDMLAIVKPGQVFSAGIVDGRNIWKTNFKSAVEIVKTAVEALGSHRVLVATSSSLLHTPHTLENEKALTTDVKSWFAFAKEKCKEVAMIAHMINNGPDSIKAELEANAAAIDARADSAITVDQAVRERLSKLTPDMLKRHSPYPERAKVQKSTLKLPKLPTTTIGSFPQTKEIRLARSKFTKGEISAAEYENFIKKEIESVVRFQERIGLDVLVHGEPERNDMVQYFGEKLKGFVFTQNGWVQSYGSRCVRPPIIVGDVSRPAPMTVKESQYAKSLTSKPMKGMLTGPITILRWSFPRDDVSQTIQAQQLALALRDEVADLEKAGINVIQVDEPALREGCPLRHKEIRNYLTWAVDAFRLATSTVQDGTQIHSHFCYSDFNDIFYAIKALDADVISIEASKSGLKLLKVFATEKYQAGIGPGVYDIHSARVPSVEELQDRVNSLINALPTDSLWLNPDCGLKTRSWVETEAALKNMVTVATAARTSA